MTKEQLMKYAEQGVRDELIQMQLKINELARLFPHLVLNADGTVPSVAPIERKPGARNKPNGRPFDAGDQRVRAARVPIAEREAQVREFLKNKPSMTAEDIGQALGGLSKARTYKILQGIARPEKPYIRGSRTPVKWVLKPGAKNERK